MDIGIASTSNVDEVEFDDDFILRARRLPINKLMEELMRIQQDNHPLLHTVRRKLDRDRKLQTDRIQCHKGRAELKAETDFNEKRSRDQKEYDARISELNEEAVRRSEEMDRTVLHEYGVIDINKPPTAPLVFESNKKTLRGRGGGQLIEPVNYFNCNQNTRIPEFKLNLAFDNARIRKELDSILNRPTDSRRKILYTVSIQKPKLIIENKSFKHGEDVYAWNRTFGEMLAKIEITNDKMITLKGSLGWDTRQMTATIEDLEEGRVTITKQRGKDKGF